MKNFPKLGNLTGLWIGLIAVFGTATAGAEEHFLICIPGAPGSSADAAERVDGFLSVLESDTGPMTGHYATRADECDRILEMHSLALLFFSWRTGSACEGVKSGSNPGGRRARTGAESVPSGRTKGGPRNNPFSEPLLSPH